MKKLIIICIIIIFGVTLSFGEVNTSISEGKEGVEAVSTQPTEVKKEEAVISQPTVQEPKLEIHGALDIPANFPFADVRTSTYRESVDIYFAILNFAFKTQYVDIVVEPRFRHSNLGNYPYPIWLEKGYTSFKILSGDIRIGKIYNPMGFDPDYENNLSLTWDNSWYGPLAYYMGFLQDSDWGLAFNQKFEVSPNFKIGFNLAYFILSDGLNGSRFMNEGRSTEGFTGAATIDERNTLTGRLTAEFYASEVFSAKLGISGSYGELILKATDVRSAQYQAAIDLDVYFLKDMIRVLGEFIFYDLDMKSTFNTAAPTRGYSFFTGFTVKVFEPNLPFFKYIAVKYTYSVDDPVGNAELDPALATQYIHTPGIQVQLTDQLLITLEYARWQSDMNWVDHTALIDFLYSF